MSDIQDRWALVADKTGVIHEYKIPLQELEESIALDAETHYVNESSAQVSIQMLLSPTVASEILISDLNFGRDSTNKDICSVFGKKISNCTVSRDAVEDIILSKYKINVKLENLNPLNKMGDGKFYLVEPFGEVWEEITNYLQNSDNGDLLTSGPETLNYNFTFSGGNIEKTIKPCTVTSQWYDISITENLKPDKISYNFILSKKQKWIPHEEANSAPFKLMLDAVDSCTRQLKKEIKF
ncbi:hypothetical protein AZH11_27445 [Pseudomonas simiae]|nr:hypothetical protein AZH11_27445 [Pseudomonas simiae]